MAFTVVKPRTRAEKILEIFIVAVGARSRCAVICCSAGVMFYYCCTVLCFRDGYDCIKRKWDLVMICLLLKGRPSHLIYRYRHQAVLSIMLIMKVNIVSVSGRGKEVVPLDETMNQSFNQVRLKKHEASSVLQVLLDL